MNKWLVVALAVGGACVACSGGTLLLALLAGDDAASGGPSALGTSECPNSVDGWTQTITRDGLVLAKGGVTAELAWPFQITDAHRTGELEPNLWAAVLGDRYRAQAFTERGSFGEHRLAGPATELSSGRTVYVAFTTGSKSGTAYPVAVIVPDEAMLRSFPTDESLSALGALNHFSLGCASVAGRWKSGFSGAAERYAAGSGNFMGVEGIAASTDMQLDGSGSFQRESSALVHGVYEKRVVSGSWTNDGWSLGLRPEGAEPIDYDAFFVAVPNGFLLHLTNRRFAGDSEEFQRVE